MMWKGVMATFVFVSRHFSFPDNKTKKYCDIFRTNIAMYFWKYLSLK